MTNLYPRTLKSRISLSLATMILTSVSVLTVAAQNTAPKTDHSLDGLSERPIYVTTRVFQMYAKRDSYKEVNDQVFKMSTASLATYDKWISTFKKLYPEFEIDQLRADSRTVFRTSKPATISLIKQTDGRKIEIQLFGAQSYGDGVTPGTSLVPEIALHFPDERANKPLGFSMNTLEVQSGQTYFFAVRNMKMSSTDFANFVRPNTPIERFDGKDIYLIFAFTVDLDKTNSPARLINEQQSVAFQEGATKKVMPEVPASLRDGGFGGNTRLRVEISPDGKVTNADVQYSTFPEINKVAIEAAKQWEFSKSLFDSDKNPITCFITFSFPTQSPTPKANSSNSEK